MLSEENIREKLRWVNERIDAIKDTERFEYQNLVGWKDALKFVVEER